MQPIALLRAPAGNAEISAQLGDITFFSETVRAFKLDGSSPALTIDDPYPCGEDYGQTATYDGSIPEHPHAFVLGAGCVFITGQRVPVDGAVAKVLASTRYAAAFRVSQPGLHRGRFEPWGAASALGLAAVVPIPPVSAGAGAATGSGATGASRSEASAGGSASGDVDRSCSSCGSGRSCT